jgi:1,4-alpha-glucan branching enzyme
MPLVENHAVRYDFSLLSDYDLHLFNEGNHNSLYEKLGAHAAIVDGQHGTYFAVWAPDAYSVSVIGEFNGWNKTRLHRPRFWRPRLPVCPF